ncbi:hypothetical protein BKA70DRAFT_1350838 [Coprinopsis sp. MPI-PUGE-AT-0042]|nr:hypothetical protein BKA70DRAFT_1350838 [Coprinopsis sp. MPI-PUGE-AT-0042]
MHRCLAVPELVRSIFSYLSQHKSTLVALVVTCRALRNPAMNELCYHVEGLPPLLMAMPKDLWLARPRTGNNVWQKPLLKRCITKQDILSANQVDCITHSEPVNLYHSG